VDNILNCNKFGVFRMRQPPNDRELDHLLNEAGRIFDRYMSIPVGALMVTKDFTFPYAFAGKRIRIQVETQTECGYNKKAGAWMKNCGSVRSFHRNSGGPRGRVAMISIAYSHQTSVS